MTIYKHTAESTENMSIFNGKIEIEVDNIEEWRELLASLPLEGNAVNCDTVCHCNVKVNAETIAKILDYDIRGEVAPFVPFFPECVQEGDDGNL